MKCHLHCAEQQKSPSKLTRYCACHKKWPQHMRESFWKRLKRHLQCGADPSMIQAWICQSATHPALEVTLSAHQAHFVLNNIAFGAPAIIPNFTKCCACQWQVNCTKSCACHTNWMFNLNAISQNIAPAMKTDSCTCHENSSNITPATKKWHFNCMRYCMCHGQWVCNLSAASPNIARATKRVLSSCATLLWFYYSLSLSCFVSSFLWHYFSLFLWFFDCTILWLYFSLSLSFFYSIFLWFYYSLMLLLFDSTILWVYHSFILLVFDSTTFASIILESTFLESTILLFF